MKIIIPTKGRLKNQLTMQNMPRELYPDIVIVSPSKERFFHQSNWEGVLAISQPDDNMGIAAKRKWIIENELDDKIVMLDDDLRFAVRRDDDPKLFRKAEPKDILLAFWELENKINERCPHAGFGVRGSGIGDAAQAGGWQTTGKRMMYSLGYHVPTIKEKIILGRLSTHEDIDVTLQLLLLGYPNAVNFSFVTDQAFGKPGGCTNERTIGQNNLDVMQLAEFFPGYVRVTEKQYKESVPRLECVCQWQKALSDGLLKRKQREQTH